LNKRYKKYPTLFFIMNVDLKSSDPEIYKLIDDEHQRQKNGLELIASENFTSKAVFECLGSVLTNKYSEGLPNKRYYGGNTVIDKIELLCQHRALEAYRLDSEEWGINVQPYSGSVANLAAYLGILKPHDRIIFMLLACGGHISHGHVTEKKRVSASSIVFETMGYGLDPKTGLIDYDDLEQITKRFRPRLIICGASAYPRDFDYARFRKIADSVGAYLLCDMAHISGLVATQLLADPFKYCDIVTTTTHKTMRGPRAGLIFYKLPLKQQIDFAVFPSLQGGPHNNQIAGVATQLLQLTTPEFKEYSQQVVNNARMLAKILTAPIMGYKLITGGTDNHLILLDLNPLGISGSKVEKICDLAEITINKNSVMGDKSPMSPFGVRIGTAALTTRGLKEDDFVVVAFFIHRAIQIALQVQKTVVENTGSKKLVDFNKYLTELEFKPGFELEEIKKLQNDVNKFATKFEFY
jgi:glycine hydroxymethyltransferase